MWHTHFAARRITRLIVILVIAAVPIGWAAAQTNGAPVDQSVSTPQPSLTPSDGRVITYTVQSGDTFTAIARHFNLTTEQLLGYNPIDDVNHLEVGQVLIVGIALFTPTPTDTPTLIPADALSAIPTTAPTITPGPTPTFMPSMTRAPTLMPTSTPAALPKRAEPQAPAPLSDAPSLPLDVVIVGGLMALGVIRLVIGFRMQRS